MKSIGLEITPGGIAVTELSSDRTGYTILSGNFFPLNPVDAENWEIDLLQALKEITQLYDFDNSTVCVSMSQSSASCRNITFPFSRRLDVLRSLPFELEEELPMGVEDGIFDAKTVSTNGTQTSVLAFAVRNEEVEKILDVLAKVHIDPDIVSVEGAAFANLFENWNEGSFLHSPPDSIPGALKLRFFIRHENTLVSVFRDRQMIFARSIPWGEKNLIFELMRQYNYPYEQAESLIPERTRVLVSMAGASAEDIKVSSAIEKTLRPFFHEMRLMLIDLQDRFNSPVDSASLTGRMGNIENINALFTKHFSIPFNTERLDGEVFSTYQVEPVSSIVERVAISIGTALEGLKKPRNPAINLRQGEFAKRNLFLEKAWTKWGHALLLVGVLYVGLIVYGFARERIAAGLDDAAYEQLQKTASKIANIPEQRVSADKVQQYLDQEAEKQDNLKVFEKVQDVEPAMKLVETLSQELPPSKLNNFDIRKVDVKYATITIEGEAQRQDTVEIIRKKLAAMASDKKVTTLPPTIKKSSGTAFAFRIRTKG